MCFLSSCVCLWATVLSILLFFSAPNSLTPLTAPDFIVRVSSLLWEGSELFIIVGGRSFNFYCCVVGGSIAVWWEGH